jgi:rare lipoprotein A
MIRVTNLENARSVVLRVNDRGPYIEGRVVDLTAGAAGMLHMKHNGVVPVLIEVLSDHPPDEQVADAQ